MAEAVNRILTITKGTLKSLREEKLMFGFLLVSLLFVATTNFPFLMKEVELFTEQEPVNIALQMGFTFINIFIVIMAAFVSVSILSNLLVPDKMVLILSKPVRRTELLLGSIFGLICMIAISWLVMIAGLELILLIHTKKLYLSVFLGLAPALLLGILCTGLTVFFYTFIPNAISGMFTLLVTLGGFGAPEILKLVRRIEPSSLSKALEASLIFLPKVIPLWGISMDMLGILVIEVQPYPALVHTFSLTALFIIIALFKFSRMQ